MVYIITVQLIISLVIIIFRLSRRLNYYRLNFPIIPIIYTLYPTLYSIPFSQYSSELQMLYQIKERKNE